MRKIIILLLLVLPLFFCIPFTDNSVAVFSEGINLPVIMYHSVLESVKKPSNYIVTTNQLEQDIIYLKNKGYTPVTCKELIKYAATDATLPENPILITFDDGMYNNFEYALPILEKYGFPAVYSIVGSYTDEYTKNNIKNPKYSYITWQDVLKYSENKYVEFANHSYDFHSIGQRYGPRKKKNETFLEYLKAFSADTQKMQTEFYSACSYKPVIYTYPFGEFCRDSERILKKSGFLVTLSCVEGINKITKNPDCLYLLKRYNRSGKLSTSEFFSKLGI